MITEKTYFKDIEVKINGCWEKKNKKKSVFGNKNHIFSSTQIFEKDLKHIISFLFKKIEFNFLPLLKKYDFQIKKKR